LDLQDVFGGYGSGLVLNGVSLTVQSGKVVAIIGANGAGKSTVLKTVFGILRPQSGGVFFHGLNVSAMRPLDRIRLGMAYCPQGRCNFPRMTVQENLQVAGFSCKSRTDIQQRIAELSGLFPIIGTRQHDYVGNMSGGQQQIVELAMAMMTRPSLLLVDEPSIGLAPLVVSEVLSFIRSINERGVTVVMVEQNARRALGVSDIGVVLERGKVRMERGAAEMLTDENVRREYLGGRRGRVGGDELPERR
jgi:branched-chain amino acid transport system ATP-binding protein